MKYLPASYLQIMIGFCLLLISCGKLPLEEEGRTIKSFIGDFETGDLSGWYSRYAEEGFSVVAVTNPVSAQGLFSVRFTLRPDDYVYDGHRAEIGLDDVGFYHTQTWYGWSFLIPENYQESREWQLIGQFHDIPDFPSGENWSLFPKHSPPISFNLQDSNFGVVMNTPGNQYKLVYSQVIQKNIWHHLVFCVYWSDDDLGWQEFWLDGQELLPTGQTGQRFYRQNMYNKMSSFLKIGLYRSPEIKTENTVYFDDVRIGASRESVWR